MLHAASIRTWIVIPTYWGSAHKSPFDHPTPLDGDSTLPRLLESLALQRGAPPFGVLVLAATADAASAADLTQHVLGLTRPHASAYPVALADHRTLGVVTRLLSEQGLDRHMPDLASYAGVRNLQLLIPGALGADLIIALDDDEVAPPEYVARAAESTATLAAGGTPFGLAGPYLDASGSPFLSEAAAPAHRFDEKSALMNLTFRRLLEAAEPYPTTPLALGGNMAFPRSLFEQVGFDPAITRGEDIDYLFNARLAGFTFHFDRQMAVVHLPPRHYEASPYGKLRHDVYRFIYQREKLRLAGMPARTFDPYPGRLLRDDLPDHARRALAAAWPADGQAAWGDPESVLEGAQAYAATRAPEYFNFARRWPAMMRALAAPEAADAIRHGLSIAAA